MIKEFKEHRSEIDVERHHLQMGMLVQSEFKIGSHVAKSASTKGEKMLIA